MNVKTILLFSLILTTVSGFSQSPAGVYVTSEDFKNGKITDYGAFKGAGVGISTKVKFEKLTIVPGKNNTYWGYHEVWQGVERDYRFDNNDKNFCHLANRGPIYIYTGYGGGTTQISWTKDTSGVSSALWNGADVHVSKGLDGDILFFNKKNVLGLMGDDPELVSQFEADKKKYASIAYNSTMLKLLDYVAKYNKRHKDK